MTIVVPPLDHAVVNARDRMDEAVERYQRLGFHMTARGYHTLGSINHLAVFGTNYLELIGFEPGAAQVRTDILRFPVGLNALVLAADDADGLYGGLQAGGVTAEKPVAFARPVTIDGVAREAKFRTVRLAPEALPSGRLYFCQHLTRDLVWRAEWQNHANGARDIARVVIASTDPHRGAAIFAAMFGQSALKDTRSGLEIDLGNTRVEIVTPQTVAAAFGAAAPDGMGRADYLAALTIRTTSLDQAADAMARGGNGGVHREIGRLVVPADAALNTTLEFIER